MALVVLPHLLVDLLQRHIPVVHLVLQHRHLLLQELDQLELPLGEVQVLRLGNDLVHFPLPGSRLLEDRGQGEDTPPHGLDHLLPMLQ